MVELICIKNKFDGELCDFREGAKYQGELNDSTLIVDSNHGELHEFENRGKEYFDIVG